MCLSTWVAMAYLLDERQQPRMPPEEGDEVESGSGGGGHAMASKRSPQTVGPERPVLPKDGCGVWVNHSPVI